MLYDTLVDCYNRLESTTKRLEMTDILADLFEEASADEVEKIVYLTQGKIHPDWKGEPEIDALKGKTQGSFTQRNLTVSDVYNGLDRIARREGQGSTKQKIDDLGSLLADSSPLGARYIARTVVGKLRLGIGDMTILDALSQAHTGAKEQREVLERAYNLSSDLGLVARTLEEEGVDAIKNFHVRVGSPIRVMAAQRLSTAEEIVEKLEGQCSAEYKLDGERFQIHKKGDKVTIFSRRLENITYMYPDAVLSRR